MFEIQLCDMDVKMDTSTNVKIPGTNQSIPLPPPLPSELSDGPVA